MTVEQDNLASVRPLDKFRVAVTWRRGPRVGKEDIVDLSECVNSYKMFRPVRTDAELWSSVHVICHGWAIGWGKGSEDDPDEASYDIDFAADALARMAVSQKPTA